MYAKRLCLTLQAVCECDRGATPAVPYEQSAPTSWPPAPHIAAARSWTCMAVPVRAAACPKRSAGLTARTAERNAAWADLLVADQDARDGRLWRAAAYSTPGAAHPSQPTGPAPSPPVAPAAAACEWPPVREDCSMRPCQASATNLRAAPGPWQEARRPCRRRAAAAGLSHHPAPCRCVVMAFACRSLLAPAGCLLRSVRHLLYAGRGRPGYAHAPKTVCSPRSPPIAGSHWTVINTASVPCGQAAPDGLLTDFLHRVRVRRPWAGYKSASC